MIDDKTTKPGLSEATLRAYMAHLKGALRWAERIGIISKAPSFPKSQCINGDQAKGRAISGEEFDRLIAAVPKVAIQQYFAEWQRYIRGL